MLARWTAVLIGVVLAGVMFWGGWWQVHRPTSMQEIEVYASDTRGNPVSRFGWTILDETPGATLFTTTAVASHLRGIARVLIPPHEITLEIESPGLHRARLGPFRPSAIPSRLEARLEDLGAVEGLVTRDGKPVPGASVGLFLPEWNRWNDAPSGLLYGFAEERTETDALGTFRIKSDSGKRDLWVRAWKEGSASGTTGPVRVGAPPIQVELHEGGILAGQLKVGPNRELKSCEVELYRQDSHDESVPTTFEHFLAPVDSAGAFVFRNVDTGPWLVRLKSPNHSEDSVPFLVTIEERQTCPLDMDLLQAPQKLVAHVTMNGRPWSPAWSALYTIGEKSLMLESVEADPNGNWTLRVRAAGRYELFIVGNHEHDTSVPAAARGEIELQRGETRFERSLQWSEKDLPDLDLNQSR